MSRRRPRSPFRSLAASCAAPDDSCEFVRELAPKRAAHCDPRYERDTRQIAGVPFARLTHMADSLSDRSAALLRGLVGALLLTCLLTSCGRSEPLSLPLSGRPNVVLIVIDTLRSDRLPFYGSGKDTAPFLAALAERSLVFDAAWSASSWTAPATASIFTGVYPNQHGVITGLRFNHNRLEKRGALELGRIPDEFETIPGFLRS